MTKFHYILKTQIFLFFITVILSCQSKETKHITIKTTTVKGQSGREQRKDSISIVSSEYFNVNLESVNNGEFYVARESVRESIVGSEIDFELINVVDDKGKELRFKDSTQFLNFMGERGYEMKEQKEKKFSFSYTFKRKD